MLINVPKNLSSGFETVPAAIYKAAVTGYKVGTSKAGNPKIDVELTIQTQGPDESVKTIGRKVFDTFTISEAALPVVNTKYKALTGMDLPAGQFEVDEFINMITSNILNKTSLVQVTLDPRQDDPEQFRNNVKKYSHIEG